MCVCVKWGCQRSKTGEKGYGDTKGMQKHSATKGRTRRMRPKCIRCTLTPMWYRFFHWCSFVQSHLRLQKRCQSHLCILHRKKNGVGRRKKTAEEASIVMITKYIHIKNCCCYYLPIFAFSCVAFKRFILFQMSYFTYQREGEISSSYIIGCDYELLMSSICVVYKWLGVSVRVEFLVLVIHSPASIKSIWDLKDKTRIW